MISKLTFVVRRRWPILVLIPALSVLAVQLLSPTPEQPPVEYKATFFVAGEPNQIGNVALQQASVDLRRGLVVSRAAEIAEIDDPDPTELRRRLQVRVRTESLTLELTVRGDTKEDAEQLASAFAQGFIDFSNERRGESQEERLAEATATRDEAELVLGMFIAENREALAAVPSDPVVEIQRRLLQDRLAAAQADLSKVEADRSSDAYRIAGSVPATRVDPPKLQLPESPAVRSILAMLISATGAVLVVALIERMNPRIDAPIDAEQIIGAPALGMVPILKGSRKEVLDRARLGDFTGPFAESFRSIRSHLDFRSNADGLNRPPCVMVVSSLPGEGKTTTAAFLSLSYVELGRDVVAIGADFRRPALHRLFGLPRSPGLSSRMTSGQSVQQSEDLVRTIVRRDDETGVRVIPSGPGTDRVSGLLGDLGAVTRAGMESGCTVILDTAPVLVANDAVDFLPMVDYVIVVVRLGKTTERALRQSVASLGLSEAKIAGCAIMGSLESADANRYYYSYYSMTEDEELDGKSQSILSE
jgi:Mrp family chromosome partitioning ATPase/capsular polysaccharide biosynthesis protein